MNTIALFVLCLIVVSFGIVAYILFIKGLITFVKSWVFWNRMYNQDARATEYFSHSPFWKIEATNEGFIKDWFGPYRFRSYGFTFYVYCKTDDVSKYWNDFVNYKPI